MDNLRLKVSEKDLIILANKILGKFAFLIQRELINRFPSSFANKIEVAKEGAAWIIGSNDKILTYYNQGTRPHIIEPKVKNALAFAWAKAPNIPRQPRQGRYIFKRVMHPGTQGKKIIQELERDTAFLQRLLDQAVKSTI